MKKLCFIGILLALTPSLSFGDNFRINQLVQEKQRKMAELEKCMGSTKGLKIAGISTLGLTAVGVAGNVIEAKKINEYDDKIESTDKSITKTQKQIEEKRSELAAKKAEAEEAKNKIGTAVATVQDTTNGLSNTVVSGSTTNSVSDNKIAAAPAVQTRTDINPVSPTAPADKIQNDLSMVQYVVPGYDIIKAAENQKTDNKIAAAPAVQTRTDINPVSPTAPADKIQNDLNSAKLNVGNTLVANTTNQKNAKDNVVVQPNNSIPDKMDKNIMSALPFDVQ